MGESIIKKKTSWPCLTVNMPSWIEVIFDGNLKSTKIQPLNLLFRDKSGMSMYRQQFGLILAYGLTIHKVQGATIKKGVVQLNFSFKPDSGLYVAITRFPSLNCFILLDYLRASYRCDMNALKEIGRLEKIFEQNFELGKLVVEHPINDICTSQGVFIVERKRSKCNAQVSRKVTLISKEDSSAQSTLLTYLNEINSYGTSIDSGVFPYFFSIYRDSIWNDGNVAGLPSVFDSSNCRERYYRLDEERAEFVAGKRFIQPLFDGMNHFITVCSDGGNLVDVYDSLNKGVMNDILKIQIWQIFGAVGGVLRIRFMNVANQSYSGNSCGIYAAVYSFCLARFHNICEFEFDEREIRSWLAQIIEKKEIASDPPRHGRLYRASDEVYDLHEMEALEKLSSNQNCGRLPGAFSDDDEIQIVQMVFGNE